MSRCCSEVYSALLERASLAQSMGIRRWNIMFDPGLGFAKTGEHNLQILQELKYMTSHETSFPVLMGPSRKGFIGHILAQAHGRWMNF